MTGHTQAPEALQTAPRPWPASPLVSVVIPTYNRAGMLVEAVESALAQTYENREIIVVDDGSTDDTAERLQPYVAAEQVRYIFQQNRRQSAARNTGIAAALGDLVAFLDSDDLWAPEKLERQVPLFQESKVGLAYCGAKEVARDGALLWEKGVEKYCRGAIFDALLFDHFITNSSVVVRRSCLNRVGGFQEDLHGAEDIHLWLRICHDYEADFVPDVLVACRNHGDNLKHDSNLIPDQRFRALVDIVQRYKLNPPARRRWRQFMADHLFADGYRNRLLSRRLALRRYLKAMSCRPRVAYLAAIVKLAIPGYEGLRQRLKW